MSYNFFISIDWGTSNLRIRVVATPSRLIVEEIVSSEGIKKVCNDWCMIGGDRETHFIKVLQLQLDQFITKIDPSWPIVISGMASSSIGIRELPYANLPFHINGMLLYSESIESAVLPNKIHLISGAKTNSDVMRGEETQIIGLIEKEDLFKNTLFILPGTHSKHILTDNGMVTGIKTFITGELFEVISQNSILKESLAEGKFGENELVAFQEGVTLSKEDGSILHSLFFIRTNTLFEKKSPTENYYFLSGLLIGDELKKLLLCNNLSLQLAASGTLFELYSIAFGVLGLLPITKIVEKDIVDKAVIKGQSIILNNLINRNTSL